MGWVLRAFKSRATDLRADEFRPGATLFSDPDAFACRVGIQKHTFARHQFRLQQRQGRAQSGAKGYLRALDLGLGRND